MKLTKLVMNESPWLFDVQLLELSVFDSLTQP